MGKEDWDGFYSYGSYRNSKHYGSSTTSITYNVEEDKQYRELEKMKLEDEKKQEESIKIDKELSDAKKEKDKIKRKKEKLYHLGFKELGFIHPLYRKVVYERTFAGFINEEAKNIYHVLKSTDEEYRPFLCGYDNGKNICVLLYLIPENINLSSEIDDYIISKEDNVKWCDVIKYNSETKVIFMLETEFLEKSNFWYNIIKNMNELNYKESDIYFITKTNVFDKYM